MCNYNKQIFNSYCALGITMSIRDLKKLIVSSARSVWEGSIAKVVCQGSSAYGARLMRKVMTILTINEGWDLFYDQNIEHKINKHPVMTVINGNNIQLMGMSAENMNVMHVPGVACLHAHTHTHTCAHTLTPGHWLPCRGRSLAGWCDFHQGVLRASHLWSFTFGV